MYIPAVTLLGRVSKLVSHIEARGADDDDLLNDFNRFTAWYVRIAVAMNRLLTVVFMSSFVMFHRYDNLYKANKRLNMHISLLVTVNIGLCAPLTVFELLVSHQSSHPFSLFYVVFIISICLYLERNAPRLRILLKPNHHPYSVLCTGGNRWQLEGHGHRVRDHLGPAQHISAWSCVQHYCPYRGSEKQVSSRPVLYELYCIYVCMFVYVNVCIHDTIFKTLNICIFHRIKYGIGELSLAGRSDSALVHFNCMLSKVDANPLVGRCIHSVLP